MHHQGVMILSPDGCRHPIPDINQPVTKQKSFKPGWKHGIFGKKEL